MSAVNIDIDGCLRAFDTQVDKVYLREFPSHKDRLKPKTDYNLASHYPIGNAIFDFIFTEHVREIFEDAPIYNGALEMLHRLQNNGHKIQIVTSQRTSSIVPTLAWLFKHSIPYDSIHFVWEKWRVQAEILLDDHVDNLVTNTVVHPHTLAVCFSRPWNSEWPGVRISEHKQLFDVLHLAGKAQEANAGFIGAA